MRSAVLFRHNAVFVPRAIILCAELKLKISHFGYFHIALLTVLQFARKLQGTAAQFVNVPALCIMQM